ncbi:MAG: DUF3343 domain-containing protein [Clostridia bacterium]|nr:DUF3343 domain-containing protein [Clostridia bacterium]
MGEILITFIKQSSAYKLKKAAKLSGISAKVVQTPKELSIGGCSYAVLAKRADVTKLINLCNNYGIDYKRVLVVFKDINGRNVYNDL